MLAEEPEQLALAGFKDLDPAGYGEPVFDENQTRDLMPCIPEISVADLLGSQALLQVIHPRERRKLWQEALGRVATPTVRTAASKAAGKKDRRMLARESKQKNRSDQKAKLRSLAADAGAAAARDSLVPESGKRKRSA